MTRDNYVIRAAGSFGEQGEVLHEEERNWSRGGSKHTQGSLRDVRHLPDNDVAPFSFAQR